MPKECGRRPPWMSGDPGKASTAGLHSHARCAPTALNATTQMNNPCMDPLTPHGVLHSIQPHPVMAWARTFGSLPHTQMHIWHGFLSVSYN